MPYNFSSLPQVQTVDELRQHLTEELQRISQAFNETTELELRPSKHAPDRPREGMIIHADGTSWDPGSGAGTYRYQGGAWVKIANASSVPVAASTTEVLTGTDAAKFTTPDSIAALWEKGADVASAGTISLGEGGYFHITGTTTITDIDFATPKDGRKAILIFDGALTLTHNATTLVIPGGANITTAAGDVCCVVQDASDNVKIAWYQKANGHAIVETTSTQRVLQVLQTTNTANTDLTTALPLDNTVPQSTEGAQVLSLSITPADNTNQILCIVSLWGSSSVAMGAALFRGTTCINAVQTVQPGASAAVAFSPMVTLDSPASASAQTYSVRVGTSAGTVMRLNGFAGTALFGGVSACTLTLIEVEA